MKAYNRAAEKAAENAETRINSDPGQLTTAERYLRMAAYTTRYARRD